MATPIFLKARFNSQPQYAAPIAPEFVKGLVFAYNPAVGVLYAGSRKVFTGTSGKSVLPQGVAASFNGSSDTIDISNTSGAFSNGITILVVGRRTAASGIQPLISRDSGSPAGGFELALYNSFGAGALIYSSQNGFNNFDLGFVNGTQDSLNGTYATTTGTVYAITAQINSLASHGSINLTLGSMQGGARFLTGDIALAAVWDGKLSADAMRRLSIDSQRLFLAPSRPLWLTSGIALDATANSGYQAAQSTYTFNRTVTGSNTFLAVDVSLLSAGQTVTGIVDDFGGANTAMTLIGAKSTVSSVGRVELWGVANPTAGTKTIQVNLSGSIASAATAVSYTGVHQTSPTEAFNSAQATNVGAADATVDITSVADNCWIHGAIATDDASVTANQTSRNNVTGAGGSAANEDNNGPKTPAGAVTMSYTGVGALATWAIGGYAIRPIAASSLGGIIANVINGAFSVIKGYFS